VVVVPVEPGWCLGVDDAAVIEQSVGDPERFAVVFDGIARRSVVMWRVGWGGGSPRMWWPRPF
jgi:hypothetical protein